MEPHRNDSHGNTVFIISQNVNVRGKGTHSCHMTHQHRLMCCAPWWRVPKSVCDSNTLPLKVVDGLIRSSCFIFLNTLNSPFSCLAVSLLPLVILTLLVPKAYCRQSELRCLPVTESPWLYFRTDFLILFYFDASYYRYYSSYYA